MKSSPSNTASWHSGKSSSTRRTPGTCTGDTRTSQMGSQRVTRCQCRYVRANSEHVIRRQVLYFLQPLQKHELRNDGDGFQVLGERPQYLPHSRLVILTNWDRRLRQRVAWPHLANEFVHAILQIGIVDQQRRDGARGRKVLPMREVVTHGIV